MTRTYNPPLFFTLTGPWITALASKTSAYQDSIGFRFIPSPGGNIGCVLYLQLSGEKYYDLITKKMRINNILLFQPVVYGIKLRVQFPGIADDSDTPEHPFP